MGWGIGRKLRAMGLAAACIGSVAGCAAEATVVGSDCADIAACAAANTPPGPGPQNAVKPIEAVDILLVVDDSNSVNTQKERLKAELPRLLNAIVTGSDGEAEFPPADSVHVAVTTTDMGTGGIEGIRGCAAAGKDGVFLKPAEVGVSCQVSYPGYLSFERGSASPATVDTVSCMPLVEDSLGEGCGYEHPLEAALKSVWPARDRTMQFLSGAGHGERENAGFLRQDSLLVVVVVSDEDDCSASDPTIFIPNRNLAPGSPLQGQGQNLRCYFNDDHLYHVERYIEGFKIVRPSNDNVIFAAISGIPSELTSDAVTGGFDMTTHDGARVYFDMVLADERMQRTIDPATALDGNIDTDNLRPSCANGLGAKAYPPRRLVQVAAGFGSSGVLGSICGEDFGTTTGRIIRAIGARLADAAEQAAP